MNDRDTSLYLLTTLGGEPESQPLVIEVSRGEQVI